jgi:hypothetical protein
LPLISFASKVGWGGNEFREPTRTKILPIRARCDF